MEEHPERPKLWQPTITVISGPMYDGKTEKLIAKLSWYERLLNAFYSSSAPAKSILAFKPSIDKRYEGDDKYVVSKTGMKFPATFADSIDEILDSMDLKETLVVGINEPHIYGKKKTGSIRTIGEALDYLRDHKITCIAAVLHPDFKREAIESTADLFSIANHHEEGGRAYCDYITETGRTCNERGIYNVRLLSKSNEGPWEPAPYTDKLVRIGGVEPMQDKEDGLWCIYRVRCDMHSELPGKPKHCWEKHSKQQD